MQKQLKYEHRSGNNKQNTEQPNMVFPVKFMVLIYIPVFILAKLFYCIDVSNETAATAFNASTMESTNSSIATETSPSDQTTDFDTQPQENGNVMQICNQTFPTPKGKVCLANVMLTQHNTTSTE